MAAMVEAGLFGIGPAAPTSDNNLDDLCGVLCHMCEQWFILGSPSTVPATAWP
jgi:hypothetical protein